MFLRNVIFNAAAACLMAGTLLADVTVSRDPLSGTSASVIEVSPGVYDVTLTTTASTFATFTVTGDSTDAIRNLVVNVDTTQSANVHIRGHTPGTSIASVDSIDIGIDTGSFRLNELRTSGDVGSITMNKLVFARIGGDVTGPIVCKARSVGVQDIEELFIEGNLLGDISFPNELWRLEVDGSIGTVSNPVSIDGGIKLNNIIADAIHAHITMETDGEDLGRIRRIETRTGGDFTGSLWLREFHNVGGSGTPGLYIDGDIDADITFSKQVNSMGKVVAGGELAAGRTIDIGKNLHGNIELASGGLKGQITINSLNDGSEWTADVKIGTTILSGASSYTATNLGGGAVGLVPFGLHRWESVPAYDGANWPTTSQSHPTIKLVHYGPVAWGSGAKPFEVFESVGDCCTGVCLHGDFFDVTDDWNLVGGTGRELVIEPDAQSTGLREGWHYHIRPVRSGPDTLFCDQIQAQDVPVADYPDYIIYRPD